MVLERSNTSILFSYIFNNYVLDKQITVLGLLLIKLSEICVGILNIIS
nr:MAG TPA: hypothetical protein [Caudoviricetes sp.]